MQFEKSHRGLGKIITSIVLSMFAAIIAAVSGILSIFGVTYSSENVPDGLIIFVLIVLVLTGIFELLALIFQLIGLKQAGQDENNFRVALWISVFSIILRVVSYILEIVIPNTPIMGEIFDTICGVCNLAVTIFVVSGAAHIMDQLDNDELRIKGEKLTIAILVLYGAGILFQLFPSFFPHPSTVLSIILTVIAAIAAIIQVVIFVQCFLYLIKARKNLK